MFLFLRLLLAHFIGDFPLQTDEVYRQKTHGIAGQILHGLVIGFTYLIFSLPFLSRRSLWILIVIFTASHIFIDWLKLKIDVKKSQMFWVFLTDQILHVSVLSLVLLFKYSSNAPIIQNPILALYNNNKLIMVATAYCVATFAGTYFLELFKKGFFQHFAQTGMPKNINYGLLERGLILTAFCFFQIQFYPLVLILCLADGVIKKQKGLFNFTLNCIYAGGIGFALKVFIA